MGWYHEIFQEFNFDKLNKNVKTRDSFIDKGGGGDVGCGNVEQAIDFAVRNFSLNRCYFCLHILNILAVTGAESVFILLS